MDSDVRARLLTEMQRVEGLMRAQQDDPERVRYRTRLAYLNFARKALNLNTEADMEKARQALTKIQ